MNFPPRTEDVGGWLRTDGPEGDVVISSRVRFARNFASYPFLVKAAPTQQAELLALAHDRVHDVPIDDDWLWLDLATLTEQQKLLLVERHLISRQFCQSDTSRGVAISTDESIAIMVNEEDHLRMQVIRSGLRLSEVYQRAVEIDDAIEAKADYAFSEQYGYLSACPTNVGTGIRVSVMLHLPALKMTGEIEKVFQAAKDMHLAVRGYYGEGTDAIGDLYQISNQTTLGKAEEAILADFSEVVIPAIIRYERRARSAMVERRADVLDDKIHRAIGTLRHARLLSSDEAMHLLSFVRLGVILGRIEDLDVARVNELLLLSQPAHLQAIAGRDLDGLERRGFRAQYMRDRLAPPTTPPANHPIDDPLRRN